MDVLSEVLRAVRLTGAIYFDVNATQPWVAETPSMSSICGAVMPEAEHVIAFHIMLDGWCWAQVGDESEPAVRVEAGDAILFPQGDNHVMTSERGQRASPDMTLYVRPSDEKLPFVLTELGGGGEKARFVCGYLGCDRRPHNPLLDALPRTLHIRCPDGVSSNLTCDLIRVALAEGEAARTGGESVLAKLSELMFVQAVRQHIEELPEDQRGWLSGLRDRHVGAALKLIHGKPAEPWTLELLAKEVGLSRSAFSDRFTHFVEEPPMRYLGRWRMQLAARAIERGVSISQAAAEVGYQSEAAFNRAFKKLVGAPPGEWRRAQSVPADA